MSFSVNVFPVPYTNYLYYEVRLKHSVDYAIITHSNAIGVFTTVQLANTSRERI